MTIGTVLLAITPNGFDSTTPPGLKYVNSIAVMTFDDTTEKFMYWTVRLPENYSSAPVLKVPYAMTSATSGTFGGSVAIMKSRPGASAAPVDVESYDTTNSPTPSAVPGTAKDPEEISIPITNNDSMQAGDQIHIRWSRNVADTATGDAEVRAVSLEYTAS